MRLTPWEDDRLAIAGAAALARRRRERGIALNAPEAIALVCDAMLEAARAGGDLAAVEAAGRSALTASDAIEGVRELVDEARLEVLVGDGTRLVVLVDPLGDGAHPAPDGPGAVRLAEADDGAARVESEETDRERRTLEVRSESRRVVRVSSHHPFDRVNPRLVFDRAAAAGFRLDLPAGASERWAPGEAKSVTLVALGGVLAPSEGSVAPRSSGRAAPRRRLAPDEALARYGPTAGDRIRLGDTALWVRVAEDRQAAGDEPIWGYAKNLRAGMAQRERASASELDVVVAGVVVIDPVVGVVKADIGIKDGRIVGVGRAGNPDISDGIELPIGPGTLPIMGYGLIATPGAVDSHVHAISPNLMPAALSAGVTTLITAGFEEPPYAMERTLQGLEGWPVNVGLQAGARGPDDAALDALVHAGAVGFKIHEDYGASPELIDHVLRYADAHDVSVSLHTDGLHETAELEDTVAAIAGRTVHAYHVEGSGGGHVPDLLGLVREASIVCSSTTPTIPWGVDAARESLPMTVLNHGASWAVPGDLELILERIHPATMAAEGPLHELGAIQIVNSDSQGMGRIMETVRRTFQLAHVMKAWRGTEAGAGHPGLPVEIDDPFDDTERVLRYLAKVTVEPAITHGVAHEVGSLAPGRLADIVLWKPAWFGAKPELVLKAGYPAWAPLGEGNASVERAEPTRYAPDWGGMPAAAAALSVTFVSGAVDSAALARRLGTRRRLVPVRGCRGLKRADLARNRATAPVDVDPTDGTVTLNGRVLAVEPVSDDLPLNRRYFLR